MNSEIPLPLLRLIADGQCHVPLTLAAKLGCSTDELARQLAVLARHGLEFCEAGTRAVKLWHAQEMLDRAQISNHLAAPTRSQLTGIEVVEVIASTNSALLARSPPKTGQASVLFAEYQTAGRGRRGRAWQSPPASGLCMSMGFRFDAGQKNLAALPLALGVATRRAVLDLAGRIDVGLKWPNDIVCNGKLGGILIEVAQHDDRALHAVAGLGINVCLPRRMIIEQQALGIEINDLATSCGDSRPGRNRLAAAIVGQWVAAVARFRIDGLASFVAEWSAADVCRGRHALLSTGEQPLRGTCCGIDDDGRLLFEVAGSVRRISVGDVSLRLPATGILAGAVVR